MGDSGVWFYIVEEGQSVLVRNPDGTMDVIVGPRRVWRGRRKFQRMIHHVAHPGDYLIVRYRDGRQEHLAGPAEVWFDPRVHQEITCEEMLQVAAKEAVVVYSQKEGTSSVQRRIEYGPTLFMPRPGEWLHTFVWHASEGGSEGVRKVPKGLVFQKLWLMPDQMYHDVTDVRTADDAVLTIRLMIFFELLDIATMLETTHDPIGDFVNAATSDVVDFTGRHDFESFKQNTDKLNELETYRQLAVRASQCGYRINKVVYRGYGAPERLQQMHDQAIEARTKLQLERATEQQAQDLESFKLESQMLRAGKRRHEQTAEVAHQLELDQKKQEAELRAREAQANFRRQQQRLESEFRLEHRNRQDAHEREHLAELRRLGVDLTAYLTQSRADRVIELRGPQGSTTHLHLDPSYPQDGSRSRSDETGKSTETRWPPPNSIGRWASQEAGFAGLARRHSGIGTNFTQHAAGTCDGLAGRLERTGLGVDPEDHDRVRSPCSRPERTSRSDRPRSCAGSCRGRLVFDELQAAGAGSIV